MNILQERLQSFARTGNGVNQEIIIWPQGCLATQDNEITESDGITCTGIYKLEMSWIELVRDFERREEICASDFSSEEKEIESEFSMKSINKRERSKQEAIWELISTELNTIKMLHLINDVCTLNAIYLLVHVSISIIDAEIFNWETKRKLERANQWEIRKGF